MNSTSPKSSNEGAEIKTVTSEALFQGTRIIHIQHGDAQYQLRLTKENKLILTK